MRYSLMGIGSSEVTRTRSEDPDVATCRVEGRLATVERPDSMFGSVAFPRRNKMDFLPNVKVDYLPLVRQIIEFMQTWKRPVSNVETLEMFAFMDLVRRSKEHGGSPVAV